MEILEVPPLSPTSKEVLSQAVKATFAGFAQERISHHFPQGTARLTLSHLVVHIPIFLHMQGFLDL